MSEKKGKGSPTSTSRGEPAEEANIVLSEEAKKLMKRKTKIDEFGDIKGVKSLKAGLDPADISSASSRWLTQTSETRASRVSSS